MNFTGSGGGRAEAFARAGSEPAWTSFLRKRPTYPVTTSWDGWEGQTVTRSSSTQKAENEQNTLISTKLMTAPPRPPGPRHSDSASRQRDTSACGASLNLPDALLPRLGNGRPTLSSLTGLRGACAVMSMGGDRCYVLLAYTRFQQVVPRAARPSGVQGEPHRPGADGAAWKGRGSCGNFFFSFLV